MDRQPRGNGHEVPGLDRRRRQGGEGQVITNLTMHRAKLLLDNAKRELGGDLGGHSPVDLLLDSMDAITSDEAREIVDTMDEFERALMRADYDGVSKGDWN